MAWPKPTPSLNPELTKKKHEWELYWLNLHPRDKKYSFVDKFGKAFISKCLSSEHDIILEIGPGPNPAIRYLRIKPENYHVVERSPEFCARLAETIPKTNIHNQDVTTELNLPPASFDRIIAAHIFEHVLDLPPVLRALRKLLKPGGTLDVILPCEAGLLYSIGRKFSSEREYRRRFGSGFSEIIRSEHVNTIFEVFDELRRHFQLCESTCFPFPIPASKISFQFNLLVGMRMM